MMNVDRDTGLELEVVNFFSSVGRHVVVSLEQSKPNGGNRTTCCYASAAVGREKLASGIFSELVVLLGFVVGCWNEVIRY
jgi:hypothetical protein